MPKRDFNKVACNYIEIILWHGCFPVNLMHVFGFFSYEQLWRAASVTRLEKTDQ